MKKTNVILILLAMLSLLGLGAVVLLFGDTGEKSADVPGILEDYQDNYIADNSMNKEIVVEVTENFSKAEQSGIYDVAFQNSVREKIDSLIAINEYSEENPLVIYKEEGNHLQAF